MGGVWLPGAFGLVFAANAVMLAALAILVMKVRYERPGLINDGWFLRRADPSGQDGGAAVVSA